MDRLDGEFEFHTLHTLCLQGAYTGKPVERSDGAFQQESFLECFRLHDCDQLSCDPRVMTANDSDTREIPDVTSSKFIAL